MSQSQNNLSRTPKTKRKTLKLLVTVEQPAGWTIPMVQQMIKDGISMELRSGSDRNPPLERAVKIVEAIRVSLQESITVYSVGAGDE